MRAKRSGSLVVGDSRRTCKVCGETKPVDEFRPVPGTPYRLRQCRACQNARTLAAADAKLGPAARERRVQRRLERANVPPGTRRCSDCGEIKTLDEYTPIKRSKGGRYGRCKRCRNRRARERNSNRGAKLPLAEIAQRATSSADDSATARSRESTAQSALRCAYAHRPV
jgi:hypothetical protein